LPGGLGEELERLAAHERARDVHGVVAGHVVGVPVLGVPRVDGEVVVLEEEVVTVHVGVGHEPVKLADVGVAGR